jgi:hypothetical protein
MFHSLRVTTAPPTGLSAGMGMVTCRAIVDNQLFEISNATIFRRPPDRGHPQLPVLNRRVRRRVAPPRPRRRSRAGRAPDRKPRAPPPRDQPPNDRRTTGRGRCEGVWRGVSKGVEDGCRLLILRVGHP